MSVEARGASRIQAKVGAAVGRPLTWIVVVAVAAAWPVAWALRTPLPPPLPVVGLVPEFELIAQDGSRFGSKDLAGRVWLASFMSTRCEARCGGIQEMTRIQGRTRNLEPAFHLVSITSDPGFDASGQLTSFARAHRASPRMWTFLTGATGAVRESLMRGLPGPRSQDPLVLVDAAGRIRGYYDPQGAEAVDRVVRDAALLVNRR